MLKKGRLKCYNQREFGGTIMNRKNIGKSADELVALWNETHPDDPVR